MGRPQRASTKGTLDSTSDDPRDGMVKVKCNVQLKNMEFMISETDLTPRLA